MSPCTPTVLQWTTRRTPTVAAARIECRRPLGIHGPVRTSGSPASRKSAAML